MRETPHYVSAVRELVRWYMSAVQDQLNTVATASHLLGLTSQAMKGRKHVKIKDFTLEAVRPEKVIKVLDDGIDKTDKIDKHKGKIMFSCASLQFLVRVFTSLSIILCKKMLICFERLN